MQIRWCDGTTDRARTVEALEALLRPYRGPGCPVVLDYHMAGARVALRLGRQWQVQPSDELLLQLRAKLGAAAVEMLYADLDAY